MTDVTNDVATPERPDYLPPQFNTPEDLATSYAELQARFTRSQQELARLRQQPPAEPPQPPAPEPPPAAGQGNPVAAPAEPGEPDGLGGAGVPDEITWDSTKAILTAETLDETVASKISEKLGVPKDLLAEIHQVIRENQSLRTEKVMTQAAEIMGGKDNFDNLINWAKQQPDWDTVREVLNGPGWQLALQGLAVKANAQGIFSPQGPAKPSKAPAAAVASPPAYTPLDPRSPEAIALTRDPRYTTDKNYREAVQQRVLMFNKKNATFR